MTRNTDLQDLLCFKGISDRIGIELNNSSKEDNDYDYKIILAVKI